MMTLLVIHFSSQQCVQNRNVHLGEEAGAIFSSTGNRISFGPVLKEADNSSFSETAGNVLPSCSGGVIKQTNGKIFQPNCRSDLVY